MTAAQAPPAPALPRSSTRAVWLPVAAVLLGTGWGANQFAPLLLVYRTTLDLGTGTLEAMFGFYALGLIPGLLLAGPVSDARGRRYVVVPAAALSLLASLVLLAGADSVPVLFLGRLLAGVSSGIVFGAGTAWLRELSARAGDSGQVTARRAAVAMTAGFALGPLVSGLLAQWAPLPRVAPYLPHIALMIVVLVALRDAPETVGGTRRRVRLAVPGARSARFRRVVAPMAPWVFAAPAIAFALLPSVVNAGSATDGIALAALVTSLTAFAGVLIQPLARRLDAHGRRNRAGIAGLLMAAAALVLAAITAETGAIWMLVPCAILLGSAYGLCLVAGLVEVGRLADQNELAGLTAAYYALTYLGFAAPSLFALAAHLAGYPTLLSIAAALALATALTISRSSGRLAHELT
ncbi:MAG: MFS transporter [Solirubrobacteraceae bacterium]